MYKISLVIFFSYIFINSCQDHKKIDDYSINAESIKTGKTIFQERCTSCHGADGTLGFSGAKNLKESKKNMDEIKSQIINGKGAMNPFKNILSPEEIDSVSLYVMTFQKK